MNGQRIPRLSCSYVVESLLLAAILAGAVHASWHLSTRGYLPQPFVWDPQDTFMDWFNVAYWSHREGVYSVWRAVYPPLSFVLLKVFSTESCYVTSSFAGRDCDVVSQVIIIGLYLLAMWTSYRALRLAQPRVAVLRGLALALGLPGLFVLERGNVLILCQMCLAATVVPGLANRWQRALSAAVMINLKPYLLLPVLSWAIQRDWRQLELAGFATVTVYLASWAIIGSGSPLELFDNTANWVMVTGSDVVSEMFYTTSFNSMFGVVDRGFPVLRYFPSSAYEMFRSGTETLLYLSQGAAAAALALVCLRPSAVTHARVALLLLLLSLTGRSPGGYAEMLVVFLVFLESWSGWAAKIVIVTAYLISIPAEWIISALPNINTASWLSGTAVTAQFGIGVGQFLRPMGLVLILMLLALDTIVRVTHALRLSWRSRCTQPKALAR